MADIYLTDLALDNFRQGYSCSQSVLSVFAESLGLPLATAFRLAAPFGGGIGRQGEVCGAASGALLALGLRFGGTTPDSAAKERAYVVAIDFMHRFEARTGNVRCRDLIDQDMRTPEGLAAARERNVFTTICPSIVAAAVECAAEILAEHAEDAPR